MSKAYIMMNCKLGEEKGGRSRIKKNSRNKRGSRNIWIVRHCSTN